VEYSLPFILYVSTTSPTNIPDDANDVINTLLNACTIGQFWREYIHDVLIATAAIEFQDIAIPAHTSNRIHNLRAMLNHKYSPNMYSGSIRWISRVMSHEHISATIDDINRMNFPSYIDNYPIIFHIVPTSKGLRINSIK